MQFLANSLYLPFPTLIPTLLEEGQTIGIKVRAPSQLSHIISGCVTLSKSPTLVPMQSVSSFVKQGQQ